MTTLAQFRTAVSAEVGLDNTASGDQPLIDNAVNEAVTDVVLRTRCRVRAATLALTIGTKDYTIDTAVLLILDAYLTMAGIDYPLERVGVDELLTWRRASVGNVSPAQMYAVAGSDLFMIYPTPATADTITFYYVPRPATLSVSSDTPSEVPAEFHPAVTLYADWQLASLADDNSSQNGAAYQARYEQEIRRIKRWVGLKGNNRLPRATIRRNRGAPLEYHDRSRYP